MKLPAARRVTAITVAAPRLALEVAELIPEVEMIQVDMLGTVNMQMAPIRNTTMTVPKERIPLPANQASFSKLAPAPFCPINAWYLLISDCMAYSCMRAHKYMMR